MPNDEDWELIVRHVPHGMAVETEISVLGEHTTEKRAIFWERLRVVDEYLSKPNASVADVDLAANKLGVSRRQFYRLLVKVRQIGPVRGLLLGRQNVGRPSAARDGLASAVDELLVAQLHRNPMLKIAELENILAQRCELLGIEPPTEWKLRTRVHALRASGDIRQHVEFGTSIVIDQIALNLPVRDMGKDSYSEVTLVIDRDTRAIAGAGFTSGDGMGLGLQMAIADFSRRAASIGEGRHAIATKIRDITWVVPPGLEERAKEAYHANYTELAKDGHVKIKIIAEGARRHGDLILRLLGDRLSTIEFRSRTPLGIDPEPTNGDTGDDFERASQIVKFAIDAWNKKILHTPSAPSGQSELARERRLKRILQQLEAFLAPINESIERDFEKQRRIQREAHLQRFPFS